MRRYIILILIHVLVKGTHGKRDWFWSKNFTDSSEEKNNDLSREFFRDTEGPVNFTMTPMATTGPSTHAPRLPSSTSELYTSETSTSGPYTSDTYTSETQDTTYRPKQTVQGISSYYKKRQQQALACKHNEHIKLSLHDFGEMGCQLCTCNKKGMMLCTRISCKDSGEDTGGIHELILHNSEVTNQELRGAVDGCQQGSTTKVGKCTCSCVLPNVLSCPKACFYERKTTANYHRPTENYHTTTYRPTRNYKTNPDYFKNSEYYDTITYETTESYDSNNADDYDTTDNYDRTTDDNEGDYEDNIESDYEHNNEDDNENNNEHNNEDDNEDNNEDDQEDYGLHVFIHIGPHYRN